MREADVYWGVGILLIIAAALLLVFSIYVAPYLWRVSVVLGLLGGYILSRKAKLKR